MLHQVVLSQQASEEVAVAVVRTTPIKKQQELPLVEVVEEEQVFRPVKVVLQVLVRQKMQMEGLEMMVV
tara:strand:+ start:102 stop:308 length:207 start_codon:yes stop_codon:yes gene_type:complete